MSRDCRANMFGRRTGRTKRYTMNVSISTYLMLTQNCNHFIITIRNNKSSKESRRNVNVMWLPVNRVGRSVCMSAVLIAYSLLYLIISVKQTRWIKVTIVIHYWHSSIIKENNEDKLEHSQYRLTLFCVQFRPELSYWWCKQHPSYKLQFNWI